MDKMAFKGNGVLLQTTSAAKLVLLVGFALAALGLVACGSPAAGPEKSAEAELPVFAEDVQDLAKEDASFYALIVGNDSRAGTPGISHPDYADGKGRSDTMVLVRVDPDFSQIALLSVPRDTAATIDGSVTKINSAYYSGGIEAAIAEVEKLTGVSIKYHFDMGFVQFEKFIDALGGITANVPIDMSMGDIVDGRSIVLAAGQQELDGPEALVLARTRSLYAGDSIDACRQVQNRQIVEAAINKVVSDPASVALLVQGFIDNVETNCPPEELLDMVSRFAENPSQLHIVSGSGPYEGGIDETAGELWLASRDEAKWRELVEVVAAGGDPGTVVPLPEVAAA